MIQRLNALTVLRMQDGKKYAKLLYNSVSFQPQLPVSVAQLGMQKVESAANSMHSSLEGKYVNLRPLC